MYATLIKSDPEIMMGKPVIAGTRITVELVLEKLSSGESIQQLLKEHPQLNKKSIFAALEFASRAIKADVVYPIREAVK